MRGVCFGMRKNKLRLIQLKIEDAVYLPPDGELVEEDSDDASELVEGVVG